MEPIFETFDLSDVLLLVVMAFILIMFVVESIRDKNRHERDMFRHNEEIRNIYLRSGMEVGWLFVYSKEEIKDEQ